MKIVHKIFASPFIASAALSLTILLGGCAEMINPFDDEMPGPDLVTTASATEARQAPAPGPQPQRDFDRSVALAQDGVVAHYPLWMQDEYEEYPGTDDRFAWTWEDYFAMPYGLSRMIVNTIGMPVSAVLYPPVPLRGSDGVIGDGPHDPQWLVAGSSPVPPDLLEIGTSDVK